MGTWQKNNHLQIKLPCRPPLNFYRCLMVCLASWSNHPGSALAVVLVVLAAVMVAQCHALPLPGMRLHKVHIWSCTWSKAPLNAKSMSTKLKAQLLEIQMQSPHMLLLVVFLISWNSGRPSLEQMDGPMNRATHPTFSTTKMYRNHLWCQGWWCVVVGSADAADNVLQVHPWYGWT